MKPYKTFICPSFWNRTPRWVLFFEVQIIRALPCPAVAGTGGAEQAFGGISDLGKCLRQDSPGSFSRLPFLWKQNKDGKHWKTHKKSFKAALMWIVFHNNVWLTDLMEPFLGSIELGKETGNKRRKHDLSVHFWVIFQIRLLVYWMGKEISASPNDPLLG